MSVSRIVHASRPKMNVGLAVVFCQLWRYILMHYVWWIIVKIFNWINLLDWIIEYRDFTADWELATKIHCFLNWNYQVKHLWCWNADVCKLSSESKNASTSEYKFRLILILPWFDYFHFDNKEFKHMLIIKGGSGHLCFTPWFTGSQSDKNTQSLLK